MKRVTRNGLIAAAAASGAMAAALPAHADSAAHGTAAGSPGLISGNTIQVPVHVPVDVCGNTVNVVGLLNPAAGNTCENRDTRGSGQGQGTVPGGGASAHGGGKESAGGLAGNVVQLPVHVPVNVTGNTVNVVGVGNAATGNTSTNTSGDQPHHPAPRPAAPPKAHTPTPLPHPVPQQVAHLAHTGADATLPALAGGAALLLGGTILYRRFRVGATR
ncbi:chaplin [Streptomyces yaanensis]|uniref:Chaplin n=1 Tax=Streptomyces yaanensis TaxID=1142239 RepID=A0ABV7S501_9ACTN|nr:chaplin [Streptomyces sp. CGMCC 4.7035]WNB99754.1 chaplin [Streptomyces sp. CGMCC 4.7035]